MAFARRWAEPAYVAPPQKKDNKKDFEGPRFCGTAISSEQ